MEYEIRILLTVLLNTIDYAYEYGVSLRLPDEEFRAKYLMHLMNG